MVLNDMRAKACRSTSSLKISASNGFLRFGESYYPKPVLSSHFDFYIFYHN